MFRKTVILESNTEEKLKKIGQRIKKARLRRNISAETISKKAGIGESTFYAIERGKSTVSIGAYVAVLAALGLDSDLDAIALDEIGKKLFWEQYTHISFDDAEEELKRIPYTHATFSG